MATQQETIDHLLDQLAASGDVSARKMFGEYCLYYAGKPVALVCDDQLFLKRTEAGRALIADVAEGHPYPGSSVHFLIDTDLWEDREWLLELIRVTAAVLPPPKPKKSKAKAEKSASRR